MESVYLLKMPYQNLEGDEKGCHAMADQDGAGCEFPCDTDCLKDEDYKGGPTEHCGGCDVECVSCFSVYLRADGLYDILQKGDLLVEGATDYTIKEMDKYGSRGVTWTGGTYLGN